MEPELADLPLVVGLDEGHDRVDLGVVVDQPGTVAQVDHPQQRAGRRFRLGLDCVLVGHGTDGPIEGILLLLAPFLEEGNVVLQSGHPHRKCS